MKKKVFTLAKEIGITSKELLVKLNELNIPAKSHMVVLDEKTVELVLSKLTPASTSKKTKSPKIEKITPVPVKEKAVKTPINRQLHEKPIAEKQEPQKPIIVARPKIKINETLTIMQLADKLNVKAIDLIKKLLSRGIMATINHRIDTKMAELIANEYGYDMEIISVYSEALFEEDNLVEEKLVHRAPVVTIMGHVDHGKTSLLDAIRNTNVISTESGGITQHIGAYKVKLPKGEVVFLDTPGHAAFTAMRARGAQVTDIVVLVVAADDGVMPQTIEAIDHANAAKVSIVVAINKIDTPGANPDKVKQELAKYSLVPEEWGGKTIFANVSAKKGTGLENLLELLLLEAEMLELKANPDRPAKGAIVEARLDKGRGPVATVLVQNGTLKLGDSFVAGIVSGKVRALITDKGERIKIAGPSTPVEIIGFSELPQAGDTFHVLRDDHLAREISLRRQELQKETKIKHVSHITLEDLYKEIQKGEIKDLKIIIKADVQGSVEALVDSMERLSTETVKLTVIHGGVGHINESDIMLASASNAIIIGFHVEISTEISDLAKKEEVDFSIYQIIYEAVNNVKLAMEGLLAPKLVEVITGKAEVRQIFKTSKTAAISGSYVSEGKITRGNIIRVLRSGEIVHKGKIDSLRRFKEDVKEVTTGYECGIQITDFPNMQSGDIIEAYEIQKVLQKLK